MSLNQGGNNENIYIKVVPIYKSIKTKKISNYYRKEKLAEDNILRTKIKNPAKIIKLSSNTENDLKSLRIEFSADKSLVDKLFMMKSLMKIKNKTYI